jgi:hypothetical protein
LKKDAEIYDGQWSRGQFNGTGIYYYKDRCKFIGEWCNNSFIRGEIINIIENRRYIGEFKEDCLHGYGTLYWNHGKYVGHFYNGMRHGHGTLFNENNLIQYDGQWLNDEPIIH